jgi:hypothetical protein
VVKGQDSPVGIMMGQWMDNGGTVVQFQAGARNFSVLQNIQTGPGAHVAPCSVGVGRCVSRGLAGHDVMLTTCFHLLLRLRVCGAKPLPSPKL